MLQQKILTRMTELNLRQADLARKSGLRTGHIAELVNGHRGKRISADTRDKLAEALEVPLSFFSQQNTQKRVKLEDSKRKSGKRGRL